MLNFLIPLGIGFVAGKIVTIDNIKALFAKIFGSGQ